MKTTKKIKLDWTKLLAFRRYQSQTALASAESMDRIKAAMVGGKLGVKTGVKTAAFC